MAKTGFLRQAAQALANLARAGPGRQARAATVAHQPKTHSLHTNSAAAAVETDLHQDLKRKHLRTVAQPGHGDVSVTMALDIRDGGAAFVVDPITGERRIVSQSVSSTPTGGLGAMVDNKSGRFEDDEQDWHLVDGRDDRPIAAAGNAVCGAAPEDSKFGAAMISKERLTKPGAVARSPLVGVGGETSTVGDNSSELKSSDFVVDGAHARALHDSTSAFSLTSSQRHTMQDPSSAATKPGHRTRPSPRQRTERLRPGQQLHSGLARTSTSISEASDSQTSPPAEKPWPQATSTYTGPIPYPDMAPTLPHPTELEEYSEPPSALADTLLAPATAAPDDAPTNGFLESYPFSAPQLSSLFEPPVDQTNVPGVDPPRPAISSMVDDPRALSYLEHGASSAEDVFKATTEIARRIVQSAQAPGPVDSVTLLPERVFTTHLLQADGTDGQRSYTVRINVDALHGHAGMSSPNFSRAIDRAAALALRVVKDANPAWAASAELNPGLAVQVRAPDGTSTLHFAAEVPPTEQPPTPLIVLRTCSVEQSKELEKTVQCMPVVLTYDRTIVEEAIAAQLLAAFKAFLEMPETLHGVAKDDGLPSLHPKE